MAERSNNFSSMAKNFLDLTESKKINPDKQLIHTYRCDFIFRENRKQLVSTHQYKKILSSIEEFFERPSLNHTNAIFS